MGDPELDGYWKDVRVGVDRLGLEGIDRELRIEKAVECYRARKDRRKHPSGDTDRQGRWYPDADEHQDCCRAIRRPSAQWPWSLMLHCRTAPHIANLFGITASELRAALRKPKKLGVKPKISEDDDEVGRGQSARAA